jgi:FkbM family methyltransferase
MIASITNWFARRRSKKTATIFVDFLAKLYGSKTKITYNSNGYWTHEYDGWIINEVYPDVRMDVEKLRKLIVDVYFNEYKPAIGDTCIDVGAGIGSESIYLSKEIGPTGKLYVIEASPLTFKLLNANIKDNKLDNTRSFNYAVSDSPGKIKISTQADNHVKNSIFTGEGEYVEAVTMDGFIKQNNIEKIDFLKANIEGAEKLLIRQFENISKVYHVAIACHDFLGRRLKDDTYMTREVIEAFLVKNNFKVYFRNTGTDYKDDWIYGVNKNM